MALLVDGAMSGEVAPTDPRAHGGVTCRVCHGIESVRPDGNGSYTLATAPIPIPRDGDDGEPARAQGAHGDGARCGRAQLCGSCHRSFLSPETGNPAHLVGQDELGAWQRSAYAGSHAARVDEPVEQAECRTCHMPLERRAPGRLRGEGRARSARTASPAATRGSRRCAATPPRSRRCAAMLRGAASIDVAVAVAADGTRTLPADGAPVTPGQPLTFDVVVRNERVGHRFPGGVLDAQDTWIEVEVRDARGRRLAEAGEAQEATGKRSDAHVLRAVQADEHGTPLLAARDAALPRGRARPHASRRATPRSCASGSTCRPTLAPASCRSA